MCFKDYFHCLQVAHITFLNKFKGGAHFTIKQVNHRVFPLTVAIAFNSSFWTIKDNRSLWQFSSTLLHVKFHDIFLENLSLWNYRGINWKAARVYLVRYCAVKQDSWNAGFLISTQVNNITQTPLISSPPNDGLSLLSICTELWYRNSRSPRVWERSHSCLFVPRLQSICCVVPCFHKVAVVWVT